MAIKLASVYLYFYNIAQAIGWSVVFITTVSALSQGASYEEAFQAGSVPARWHQLAAALEIVHAAAGIVHSNPVNNFWQWLGRTNALVVFAMGIPELQSSVWPMVMLLVWSFGEMIRYPWYALTIASELPVWLTIADGCPAWLTWLRYTAFIPLYPIGVVAEMKLLFDGVPYVQERSIASISMPNTWNFAWDHALFVKVMLPLYPFLWWRNYSSLLKQRKRRLQAAAEAPAASGAEGGVKED